ncbi:hypothetical protein BCR44DRAFT_1436225 [Catenaria anguillulae PL171]|uniref:Uncharacterized protein n=1 Tax=Catenaria anguillulae PL171 TaxID=765915 RepID=A0A1Y2HIL0_9FUNG|nr:hypothetical protein BCR44DRAFT_1436225 [Catenaria anguillulae PL171]
MISWTSSSRTSNMVDIYMPVVLCQTPANQMLPEPDVATHYGPLLPSTAPPVSFLCTSGFGPMRRPAHFPSDRRISRHGNSTSPTFPLTLTNILDIANVIIADFMRELEVCIPCLHPDGNVVILVGTACCFMGNGPKHSLFCNHAGVRSLWFCRMCEHERSSDTLVDHVPLDSAGRPLLRSAKKTVETIEAMLDQSLTDEQVTELAKGTKAHPNAILTLEHMDIHRHSIALSCLLNGLKADSGAIAFLNSIDPSSFQLYLDGNTIIRHSGSMVGSDLKYVGQVFPYLARFLASRRSWELIPLCASNSSVTKLLYQSTVHDQAGYSGKLKVASGQVLRLFCNVPDFKKIGRHKFKVHQHVHVDEHLDEFVHYLPYQCEAVEGTNGDVREQAVYSNWQAVLRDLALSFALLVGFLLVVSGGRWQDKDGQAHKAGPGLIRLFESKAARDMLYFAPPTGKKSGRYNPGDVYLEIASKESPMTTPPSASAEGATPAHPARPAWNASLIVNDHVIPIVALPLADLWMSFSQHLAITSKSQFQALACRSYRRGVDRGGDTFDINWSVVFQTADDDLHTLSRGRVLM